jgi:hypothetical protein
VDPNFESKIDFVPLAEPELLGEQRHLVSTKPGSAVQ